MNNSIVHKQSGFTLVEIAIVILIASLMVTGVVSIASTQMEKGRYESTLQKQIALKKSILTFLSRNRRLPCPAVATLAQGAANYGIEAATPGTCLATTQFIAGVNRNARGVIPWISLGIDDEMALDGYGRRFTYQVLLSQTAVNAASGTGLIGNINLLDGAGGVSINPLDPAAAVILSHGNNGYGAYLPQTGIRMTLAPAVSVNSLENTDNDIDFVIKEYSNVLGVSLYDDIVMWLKPSDLNLDLVELGVLTAPNISVNQQLAIIRNALLSYVANDNLDPDGGGPRTLSRKLPYADCTGVPNGTADNVCTNGVVSWVDLGLDQAGVIDPWGTYINYVVPDGLAAVGDNGITESTATGPPQVILTVSGKDGLLGTVDDTALIIDVGEIRASLKPYGHNFDP